MIGMQEILTSLNIGLIFGIVAIGIFLTFRTINFADMTCDGSFVLGASVSAVLIKYDVNPYIALVTSFISGGIAGFCTGILNVKFRIADLLSGIIIAFMLYSINLRIMEDAPNITLIDKTTIFENDTQSFVATAIILFLILGVVFMLFSKFGLKLRAVGYNQRFASISGININFMKIAGLMISNALIATGGGLFTNYQGFCDISGGIGTLVCGLASVIIGERILRFKKEPLFILSCVIGSIIYRIFINIALHGDILGIKTQDINLITGGLIIAIIIMKKGKIKC
ncbi:MAG: hypothetical protein LBE97_02815 [Holosporales bacterium]|nr:hypothetical protein [Holosporales bacterium]